MTDQPPCHQRVIESESAKTTKEIAPISLFNSLFQIFYYCYWRYRFVMLLFLELSFLVFGIMGRLIVLLMAWIFI